VSRPTRSTDRRQSALRHLPAALVAASVVELGLRLLPLPRLACMIGVPLQLTASAQQTETSPERRRPLPHDAEARYRAAVRLVRIWPFGGSVKCLRTALVAGHLLRRHRPILYVGAARIDGRTVAHAWIVVDGVTVDESAARYTPLATVQD
jgi:hypothetical protein